MPTQPHQWVNVSNHAVTLASGQPLAPGDDPVECPMTDPHDKALRDSGQLIKAETDKEKS